MTVALILKGKGSRILSANPEAPLVDISKKLAENKIGCIVIVDSNGALCGIVSERDIVRTIAQNGPSVLSEPVSSCMTKNVVTCTENNTVEDIMSEMSKGRFRHMPVIKDDQLIGLVSIGDVVRARIAEAEMEAAAMRQYIAAG